MSNDYIFSITHIGLWEEFCGPVQRKLSNGSWPFFVAHTTNVFIYHTLLAITVSVIRVTVLRAYHLLKANIIIVKQYGTPLFQ